MLVQEIDRSSLFQTDPQRAPQSSPTVRVGCITFEPAARRISVDTEVLLLTTIEYRSRRGCCTQPAASFRVTK